MTGTTGSSKPDPVDLHVGSRIRQRRMMLGYSQEALAARLGMTFQQVQKYERGLNRVSASKLYDVALSLNVAPGYFFEGMPEDVADRSGAKAVAYGDAALSGGESDPMSRRETLELFRAYSRIRDPAVRKRVFMLVKALSTSAEIGEAQEDPEKA